MTTIARYPGNRRTAFMLQFDDNCDTHLDVVDPMLRDRGLAGVYYINVARPQFQERRAEWERLLNSPGGIVANHTYSHVGASSVSQMEEEIARANDAIRELVPGPWPRLVSYARPGGVQWTPSVAEEDACLAKHHLIRRPAFLGPVVKQKTVAESLATIDDALASGEAGHLDFHGVAGDWHVTPLDWFTAIVDRLAANLEQVWMTDPARLQEYRHLRETATVNEAERSERRIRLTVSSTADPALYTAPLTLLTPVPWTTCRVTVAGRSVPVAVKNGVAQYDAPANGSVVELTPA